MHDGHDWKCVYNEIKLTIASRNLFYLYLQKLIVKNIS